MKKLKMCVMAVLFAVMTPMLAEAQFFSITSLTVKSHLMATNAPPVIGQGGVFGFSAGSQTSIFAPTLTDWNGAAGPTPFEQYVMFCIDGGRSISVGTTYGYTLYSFSQFALSTFGTDVNVNVDDLAFIANAVNQYAVGNTSNNNTIQAGIWSRFANVDNSSYTGGFGGNWGVLANGVNQTFLVELPQGAIATVPEPSTYAMIGMGLVGLVSIARRRKQSV